VGDNFGLLADVLPGPSKLALARFSRFFGANGTFLGSAKCNEKWYLGRPGIRFAAPTTIMKGVKISRKLDEKKIA
jgi:hypothetical protein